MTSNIIKGIFGTALLSAVMTLSSCNIAPDDRYVEMPAINAERTVLLMDFTGQICVNCPAAHEKMEDLKQQYGDKLVCVSIHAGEMATSVNETNFEYNRIGLMIEAGNQMNDAFGITKWPMGVVDKINDKNAAILMDEWAGAVRLEIEKPTDISIDATAEYQGNDIVVKTELASQNEQEVRLQVWVIEDGIIATQLTPDGRDKNYVHNNVLRDVKYDASGLGVNLTPGTTQNVETTIACKWTDKERWNKENLSVVAFVFKGTEILNVVRTPLKVSDKQ